MSSSSVGLFMHADRLMHSSPFEHELPAQLIHGMTVDVPGASLVVSHALLSPEGERPGAHSHSPLAELQVELPWHRLDGGHRSPA